MISAIIKNTFLFVVLVVLQVLLFNNIQFSMYINPYVYVLFILLLPFETPRWIFLVSGFLLGILLDIFSHTMGIHATACVFASFMRPYVLQSISPRDGYKSHIRPGMQHLGVEWFIKYTLLLVFAHHTVLFYVEVFKFTYFFHTLLRVFISTIFTSIFIIAIQLFSYKK